MPDGEPGETTKPQLQIEDVIDKLFKPIISEIEAESYCMSVTRLIVRAFWAAFGGQELHTFGSNKKYDAIMQFTVLLENECKKKKACEGLQ